MSPRILFLGPMLGRHANRVPNPAEELAPRLQERGYECLLASSVTNRFSRLFDLLWTLFKARRHVDVISLQTYSGPSFIVEDLLSLVSRAFGLRLVMVLHGGGMPEFSRTHQSWTRRVLGRAHSLVTPSVYVKNELAEMGFPIRVIPNGMDIQRYPFCLRKHAKQHLVWLRAFHAVYQPGMAVQVLAKLTPEFPDLKLTMIGPAYRDGSLQETKRLAHQLEVSNNLQIVGYVPKTELPCWLAKGDIFLNTTRYESFGIATMEAAAMGLPVVTTNVGELSYLWQHAQNAMLVDPDDVRSMAQAVRSILRDDTTCTTLSRAARQKAEQYDWPIILPQWVDLFEGVMGQEA